MIQPVAGHDVTKKTKQPHVVYKRSPDEFQTERFERDVCNVLDDTSRNIVKQNPHSDPRDKVSARGNNSRSYTLELLVVLDKSLLDYHRDYDVENYVLTLFNMVSPAPEIRNAHAAVRSRLAVLPEILKKAPFLRQQDCFTTPV